MRVFGLTGGIASGKSTVSRMFTELGAEVIDADLKAHEMVAAGSPGLTAVVAEFGSEILLPDGDLDRKKLARVVFSDPARRAKLNAIVHPLVFKAMLADLQSARKKGRELTILDVPLLFESSNNYPVEGVIVVWVRRETQIARLKERDDLSRDEIEKRLNAQMRLDTKRDRTDYLIDNEGSLAETRAQVESLYEKLSEGSR